MTSFFERFEAYVKGEKSDIAELVVTDDKGDALKRLDIYRYAYQKRLVDILMNDYVSIYKILGTEAFFEMAKDYLQVYPSTSFTVRHFGQHLAAYFFAKKTYADYPYLSQLADFEWAKATVFDAPDTPVLSLSQLENIPLTAWEDATFSFIPAMKRLLYDYNIPQIWQSLKDGGDISEPVALEKPLSWVIWRKSLNPHWYSMPKEEDWFFIEARRGTTFGELCQGLFRWHDDEETVTRRAAEIIRKWLDQQLLENISY